MPKNEQRFERYGLYWSPLLDPVLIEMHMIKNGGQWKKKDGSLAGKGLFYHYRALQSLLWPEDDHHRWSDLMLQNFLENTITCVLGPKDSSKTHTMSKFGLTDYFVFPNDTLVMISSTDLRGLEYRVWGDLKGMFQRAKERYDWLPGFLIDSKHAICTQNVREEEVRDMRKGLVCIPCLSSTGQYIGLGKYVGIKQKRRRLLGDELQFMRASYVEAIANLNSGDFKGVFIGNPLGENDPLDKVSEPLNGWPSIGLPEKTTVWTNRFLNGKTVNLVGTDSPNFDFPQDKAPRYSYLINQGSIDRVVSFYKKDSSTYFSQCVGIRRTGVDGHRVITRQICDQFNAFKNAVWEGTNITRIYGLDAAYGNLGGDRCVGGYIEFGRDADGLMIMRVNPPVIIPVSVKLQSIPEDQIATFVMNDCISAGIPPENVFFDSTGRGSLGTSFARIWSAMVNPVEFGGKASQRPVSDDLLIYDPKLRRQRLKRCDEEYRKFVTELWFSVRRIIEAGQMCELPLEVMEEGCMREWKQVEGNKIEIESKKETKERMGRSPDLFDWLCWISGTLISTPKGDIPIEQINPGDEVLTPYGIRKVSITHASKSNNLCKVTFSNGSTLIGKGQHKVFTWDKGWTELQSLSIDNDCESVYGIPKWNILNSLFTTAGSTGFKALVNTIRTEGTMHRRDFYIESFGLNIVELFLKVCVSIIKMVTGQIMRLPILNWLGHQNTWLTTWLNKWLIHQFEKGIENECQKLLLPLFIGIIPKLEKDGTVLMPVFNGNTSELQNVSSVQSVARNSDRTFRKEHCTVQINAPQNNTENAIRLLRSVASAVINFLRSNINILKPVPRIVERLSVTKPVEVYNLTLEKDNVYYANGILVENCCCVEGARQRGFVISSQSNEDAEYTDHKWKRELEEYQFTLATAGQLNYDV